MNLPVEGAFHNLVLRLDQEAVPVSRAANRARALGRGADDVLEGHLRRRRGRRRAEPGRGRVAPAREPRSEARPRRSSTGRSISSITARTRRSAAARCASTARGSGREEGYTREWPEVVPHERRTCTRASTRCGGARDSRARRAPDAHVERRPRRRSAVRDVLERRRANSLARARASTTAPIADVAPARGDEAAHANAVRAMFDRIAPTYDR